MITHSKINLPLVGSVCFLIFLFLIPANTAAGPSVQSQLIPFRLLHYHKVPVIDVRSKQHKIFVASIETSMFFSVCIDPNPEVLCPYSGTAALTAHESLG